ncbi:MAG TPA: site-specific integrase, partial [Micromonosporaceae bacterium]
KPIATIRPSDIQALTTGLSVKLAASTVRTMMTTVKAVFRAAVHDRVIGLNPTERVVVPAAARKQIVPLPVETVETIASGIKAQYRALVVLGAGAGLRPGELFGLRVDDIDFMRRTVRVERQVVKVDGVPQIGPPKTRSSYRTIPIGDTVIVEVSAHISKKYPNADGLLFPAPAGGLINDAAFGEHVWKPAVKKAGATHVGPHSLRHFYASVLIAAGQSVKVVSERLGHSNAAMTLNTYSHLWPVDEDKTRSAIDDVFQPHVPRTRPASETGS